MGTQVRVVIRSIRLPLVASRLKEVQEGVIHGCSDFLPGGVM